MNLEKTHTLAIFGDKIPATFPYNLSSDKAKQMNERDLLRCLLHVIGRTAINPKEVRTVIGKGKNRVKAFNLFDGSRTMQAVARATKINGGNVSRAAGSWVKNGIAFWIGDGNDARLLHIYTIPEKEPREGAE